MQNSGAERAYESGDGIVPVIDQGLSSGPGDTGHPIFSGILLYAGGQKCPGKKSVSRPDDGVSGV